MNGFTAHVPANWSRLWVTMWLTVSPAVIALAFVLPFWAWTIVALIGFALPEAVSLIRADDTYPPLTHTLRHFVPNWVAFPIIYGALGSVGAHWLDFAAPFKLGALFALLGWLQDHFAVTYAHDDPYPFSDRTPRIERKASPS